MLPLTAVAVAVAVPVDVAVDVKVVDVADEGDCVVAPSESAAASDGVCASQNALNALSGARGGGSSPGLS